MNLDYKKELTPVIYGYSPIRILKKGTFSPKTTCFAVHWHERMELIRVVSGSFDIEIDSKTLTVNTNELAIIPPSSLHGAKSGENGVTYHTIMFDVPAFYSNTAASDELLTPITKSKVSFSTKTDLPEIIAVADRIIESQEENKNISQLFLISAVYELFGLLYKHCLRSQNISKISDKQMLDIIEYINNNFPNNIHSSGLSHQFGISHGYFCRKFKSATGYTPAVYIQILRLEEAKKQMLFSKESISNISFSCGFSDVSYFCRCFKRRFGMTPSEFMKNQIF